MLTVDTTLLSTDFKQENVSNEEVEQLNKHMSLHMHINRPNRGASLDYYESSDPPTDSSPGPTRSRVDSATDNNSTTSNLPAGVIRNKINTPSIKQHAECRSLIKRIKALEIPPLPADFGFIGIENRKYNGNNSALRDAFEVTSESREGRNTWRPKENLTMFIASLNEHNKSVAKLAVAPDNSFFASCSTDKTVKIWQCKGVDHTAFPRSSLTYTGHSGPVTDVTFLENSHSIASCSTDGTVHVWRVDVSAATTQSPAGGNTTATLTPTSTYSLTGSLLLTHLLTGSLT